MSECETVCHTVSLLGLQVIGKNGTAVYCIIISNSNNKKHVPRISSAWPALVHNVIYVYNCCMCVQYVLLIPCVKLVRLSSVIKGDLTWLDRCVRSALVQYVKCVRLALVHYVRCVRSALVKYIKCVTSALVHYVRCVRSALVHYVKCVRWRPAQEE